MASKNNSTIKKAGVIIDNLDSELVLHQKSSKPSKVKQMRVPTTLTSSDSVRKAYYDEEHSISQSRSFSQESSPQPFLNKLPKTYQEIETAGSAFLDMIGDNLKFGYVY